MKLKKPFYFGCLKSRKKKVRNVYLCVGFLSKQIKEYVDKTKSQFKLKIFISVRTKARAWGAIV